MDSLVFQPPYALSHKGTWVEGTYNWSSLALYSNFNSTHLGILTAIEYSMELESAIVITTKSIWQGSTSVILVTMGLRWNTFLSFYKRHRLTTKLFYHTSWATSRYNSLSVIFSVRLYWCYRNISQILKHNISHILISDKTRTCKWFRTAVTKFFTSFCCLNILAYSIRNIVLTIAVLYEQSAQE